MEKITKELSESRSTIQALKDSISARDEELKKLRENPPAIPVKKTEQHVIIGLIEHGLIGVNSGSRYRSFR